MVSCLLIALGSRHNFSIAKAAIMMSSLFMLWEWSALSHLATSVAVRETVG